MLKGTVTKSELKGELADMLRVCFEGEVAERPDLLSIQLPSGQKFGILVTEWDSD